MYRDSSFMVLFTTHGESRPVCRGVYTIGGYIEGYFYPNMGGSMILGLGTSGLGVIHTLHVSLYFAFLIFVCVRELVWLCWNDKVSTIKVPLLCRLSTDVPELFIYRPLYNTWRIETCLRRCVHNWRLRRGVLLPSMGGNMILGLTPLRFRRYTDSSCFCISPFYHSFVWEDIFWLCAS